VKIIKYRTHQGFDLLTFENLDNINLVEKFKGHDLYVENNNPTKLKPYEYHQKDIIGLSVFQNNINIGIVEEIRTYPQCDYLVIAKIDGKKSLIPFRKEFILSVNQADRQILIVEMEGLL
jgi:16S rRNA processing protein RimM